MCMRTTRHRGKLKQYMSLYRVFAWQPCWMAVTIRFLFSGKLNLFLCKTFSLFLPSNMAAMQTIYSNPKPSLTCPVNRIAPFVTTVVHFDVVALAVAVTSNHCFAISSITNPTVAAAVAMDSGEWVPFGCAHSYTRVR